MSEMNCAYYVGTHQYSYRSGEPAQILEIGTYFNPDKSKPPTVCFHVRYADGKHDYCPVSDYQNYKVLAFNEVRDSYMYIPVSERKEDSE